MKQSGTKLTLGLGVIKNIKDLRDKVNRAKNNPTELTNLLCKDFNIRQNEANNWLDFNVIRNEETFDIEEVKNTYAIGGVDLSSTTDLTCATLLVVKGDKKYVLQQYFIPSEMLDRKEREDKVPYEKWKDRGLVTITYGAKVDYHEVTKWFEYMRLKYDISPYWIGYDPWNAPYWVDEMKSYGYNMVEVRQGAKTMSNPMKLLEADLIEKKVNYNRNPVLEWCLLNTAVKRDENDNIRPDKSDNKRARIDGAVSLIIAYSVLGEHLNEYMNLQEGHT